MTTAKPVMRFPFPATNKFDPPAEHAALRAAEPVGRVALPTGHTAWVVSRYAQVKQVCTDPRFSKEAITRPDAPRLMPIQRGSKSLVITDPPEHTRLRKIVSRAFTSRRIAGMRPHIAELTTALVDRMVGAGPPADLVSSLALPLPVTVICEMLGVPAGDQERFRGWTDAMLTIAGGPTEELKAAVGSLRAYLAGLIAEKLRGSSDDLLSVLGRAHAEDDRLDREELLAFCMTLLAAGYHTTTAAITHFAYHLLHQPELYRRLVADPALIPSAVEELLRFSQIGGGAGTMRIATEDVELDGVTIRAGEAVIPLFNSANRDEDVFADPQRIDLARTDNPQIAFGHGIHYCLGAQLGRLELQVVLAELTTRLPGLRLAAPTAEISWQAGLAFPRPVALPLAW
ncbi:cytochrome P450 [Fodinicola acaciae]|uniref:cytochrome P450 n=1 Tax=Fodinicola acaciae TaxID=2681555 RepID=UPI0013D04604|nr:cytochrome P450 [Fodinicola acaciae]